MASPPLVLLVEDVVEGPQKSSQQSSTSCVSVLMNCCASCSQWALMYSGASGAFWVPCHLVAQVPLPSAPGLPRRVESSWALSLAQLLLSCTWVSPLSLLDPALVVVPRPVPVTAVDNAFGCGLWPGFEGAPQVRRGLPVAFPSPLSVFPRVSSRSGLVGYSRVFGLLGRLVLMRLLGMVSLRRHFLVSPASVLALPLSWAPLASILGSPCSSSPLPLLHAVVWMCVSFPSIVVGCPWATVGLCGLWR